MKPTRILTTTSIAFAMILSGCKDKQSVPHDHDGDGKPDHSPDAHQSQHEEPHQTGDDGHQHNEHDHASHDHGKKQAGPNGGRIITSVEPHAEFSVSSSHKVRITFLNDSNQAVPVASQTAGIICGDRSSPTMLSFRKVAGGEFLESDEPLPAGDKFPVILTIKTSPDASPIREKFILNLDDCAECNYKEYACTCDHHHDHEGHGHGHGHDHDH